MLNEKNVAQIQIIQFKMIDMLFYGNLMVGHKKTFKIFIDIWIVA